jgi:hypothetical protein
MTNTESHSLTIAYGYIVTDGVVGIAEKREDGTVIHWAAGCTGYDDYLTATPELAATFTTKRP